LLTHFMRKMFNYLVSDLLEFVGLSTSSSTYLYLDGDLPRAT
jgi:hypothetical protein